MKNLLCLISVFGMISYSCFSYGNPDETMDLGPCISGPHYVTTSSDAPGPPSGSLREAIQLSCPGDTIYFDPGTNTDTIELHNELTIYHNLVIIGNGKMGVTVISGRNQVRVFQVMNGSDVTFYNMEMIRGRISGPGAAIHVQGDLSCSSGSANRTYALSHINIIDCHIHHMAALASHGGAVYSSGSLSVRNSAFWLCRALRGGAIYHTNDSHLDVDNSRFVKNFAFGPGPFDDADGGAIHIDTYTGNGQYGQGGGGGGPVMILPKTTLDDVTIRDCLADDDGGGVYSRGDLCVNRSVFQRNAAGLDCNFYDNDAGGDLANRNTPDESGGGAIYSGSCVSLDVDSSWFGANKVYGNGGAVYIAGDGLVVCQGFIGFDNPDPNAYRNNITNSIFVRDSALACNRQFASGDISRSGNTFAGGGAVYVGTHNQLKIDHCRMDYNYSYEDGGAVMMGKTTSHDNPESTDDVSRGETMVQFKPGLNINYSRFRHNRAISQGGAIFASKGLGMDSCIVDVNKAYDGGGVMLNTEHTEDMVGHPGAGNTDRQLNGGSFHAELHRVTFRYNKAINYGGGMKNAGSHVNAREVHFIGNTACQYGGGYFQALTCPMSITDFNLCRFDRDTAHNGGGIYNEMGSCITLDSSSISRCAADLAMVCGWQARRQLPDHSGGGILNKGFLLVDNSTIAKCSANQGGGIFNESNFYGVICIFQPPDFAQFSEYSVLVRNSTISGDLATGSGGGIYNNGHNMSVENSTIARNLAGDFGGGVYSTSLGIECNEVNFYSSLVASNHAATAGDDIFDTHSCHLLADGDIPNPVGGISQVSSDGYNLVGDTTHSGWIKNVGDTVGNTANRVYPLLHPLQDNGGVNRTHRLKCASPAFDAGDGAGPDQRGYVLLGQRDIGAFESQVDLLDADGDGYCAESEDPNEDVDCEPDDPNINPGADEICGNQIDEDCDGELLLIDPDTDICCALGDNSQYYIPQIISVIDNIIMSDGPSPIGYWDYTNTYFGSPYYPGLFLQLFPGGPAGLKHWLVWIDYDDSNTFDPVEKVIDYCTAGVLGQFVFFPPNAAPGPHTMRVVMIADTGPPGCYNDPYDPNACGEVGPGEVEDYTVCIGGGCTPAIAEVPGLDRPSPGGILPTGFGEGEWKVFPNPFTDQFMVALPSDLKSGSTISLLNATGQQILNRELLPEEIGSSLMLDGSQLSPGYYLVKLTSGNEVRTNAVIKK